MIYNNLLKSDGVFWVRLWSGGPGLWLGNYRRSPPAFSERNGLGYRVLLRGFGWRAKLLWRRHSSPVPPRRILHILENEARALRESRTQLVIPETTWVIPETSILVIRSGHEVHLRELAGMEVPVGALSHGTDAREMQDRGLLLRAIGYMMRDALDAGDMPRRDPAVRLPGEVAADVWWVEERAWTLIQVGWAVASGDQLRANCALSRLTRKEQQMYDDTAWMVRPAPHQEQEAKAALAALAVALG